MVTIRHELPADAPMRELLLDESFGRRRMRKTSQRLRDGRRPSAGLAFSAVDEEGCLVATLRLWDIVAGSAGRSLLLGPVAVCQEWRNQGIGTRLISQAMAKARRLGHPSIILVGDLAYYERFGFTREAVSGLQLPGPVERDRFLGLELEAGALSGASGMVRAGGLVEAVPAAGLRATA
jgi:predicted N-acetyltransferase YhbS